MYLQSDSSEGGPAGTLNQKTRWVDSVDQIILQR
jgi:hypothetical protein